MVITVDATAERWDDVVAVLDTRGDQSRCWCQWFRLNRPGFYDTSTPQRRAALRAQVEASPRPACWSTTRRVFRRDGAPSRRARAISA